jgi:hypothetical protein
MYTTLLIQVIVIAPLVVLSALLLYIRWRLPSVSKVWHQRHQARRACHCGRLCNHTSHIQLALSASSGSDRVFSPSSTRWWRRRACPMVRRFSPHQRSPTACRRAVGQTLVVPSCTPQQDPGQSSLWDTASGVPLLQDGRGRNCQRAPIKEGSTPSHHFSAVLAC